MFGLVVHVHPTYLRQAVRLGAEPRLTIGGRGIPAHPAGHGQPGVTPALGAAVVPAFQGGCGRAQHHPGALQLRPVYRQVARRIACPLLAFVTRVVLLINHDQLQAGHRGKNRHARAQHNARRPAVGRQPAVQPLRRCHAAVHGHQGLLAEPGRKAGTKAGFELGREVDLGHHHQRLRLRRAGQQPLHQLQVDLGFTAAGGAKQQARFAVLLKLCEHLRLFGCQGHRLEVGGRWRRRRVGQGLALEPAPDLHRTELAQLRGQRRQYHLPD